SSKQGTQEPVPFGLGKLSAGLETRPRLWLSRQARETEGPYHPIGILMDFRPNKGWRIPQIAPPSRKNGRPASLRTLAQPRGFGCLRNGIRSASRVLPRYPSELPARRIKS